MDEFTLTKLVAKHGSQSIIVLPKILDQELRPKTLIEVKIKILKRPDS
jgi:hypothetical protein